MAWQLRRSSCAEEALEGRPLTAEGVVEALEGLQKDICPGNNTGTGFRVQGLYPVHLLLHAIVATLLHCVQVQG